MRLIFLPRKHFNNVALPSWAIGLLNERVIGIEPTSSAWKADALAVVLYPQIYFCFPWDQPKVQKLKPVGIFWSRICPTQLRGLYRTQTCDPCWSKIDPHTLSTELIVLLPYRPLRNLWCCLITNNSQVNALFHSKSVFLRVFLNL